MIKNHKDSNYYDIEESADGINCQESAIDQKKTKKIKYGKIILWTVCAAMFLCTLLVLFLAGDVTATIDGDVLKIKATLTQSSKVSISDIESVECTSNISSGNKEMGSDLYKISTGTFSNDDYGRYKLYIYNNVNKYVIVKTKTDNYYVFNLKTESETSQFATTLQSKLA